jgi:hypothetical protein
LHGLLKGAFAPFRSDDFIAFSFSLASSWMTHWELLANGAVHYNVGCDVRARQHIDEREK